MEYRLLDTAPTYTEALFEVGDGVKADSDSRWKCGTVYSLADERIAVTALLWPGNEWHEAIYTTQEAASKAYLVLSDDRCGGASVEVAKFIRGYVSEEEWTLAILSTL